VDESDHQEMDMWNKRKREREEDWLTISSDSCDKNAAMPEEQAVEKRSRKRQGINQSYPGSTVLMLNWVAWKRQGPQRIGLTVDQCCDQNRLPVRLFDPVISHLISIVLCAAETRWSVAAGGRSVSASKNET
jgi:hypothetical protein